MTIHVLEVPTLVQITVLIKLDGETQNKTVADLCHQLLEVLGTDWISDWSSPGECRLSIRGSGDVHWLLDRWEEIRQSAAAAHAVRNSFDGQNEPLRLEQFEWTA